VTDRPPPYRIRRMRYPQGWRWVVLRHLGGYRRGYYITARGSDDAAFEPDGHETWEQAMADVDARVRAARHP